MKAVFKAIVVAILTWEAQILLKRKKPTIIAITGSVGKTSVKDAVFTVLKDHISTRKSEKSFNSEIGVPLTILGLENAWSNPLLWIRNIVDGLLVVLHPGDYPEVLVIEAGIDKPGDMERLTRWLKPNVAVLTRLPEVPVHVEYFSSPEDVSKEKLKLVDALVPDGVLVYNNDDEQIRRFVDGVRHKAIGYSRYSPSQYTATGDTVVYDGGVPVGMEFTLTHLDTEAVLRVNGSLGVQHVYNYAAAAAVASVFDVALPEAMKQLTTHEPPSGRMRLLKGLKDTYIIDDSYNSSPVAAERALAACSEIRGFSRKIVVMGDMLELGKYSVREHERLGEQAAEFADVLLTVGVRSRSVATGALEKGMSEKHIYQYDVLERAANELQSMLQPGDLVLVKASQGIRAEKIVEAIMAEPERAGELLVRQDSAWQGIPTIAR